MVFRKAAEVLDNREAEGDGLARSCAGLSDDVAPGQDVVVRDGLQQRSSHQEIELSKNSTTTHPTRKKTNPIGVGPSHTRRKTLLLRPHTFNLLFGDVFRRATPVVCGNTGQGDRQQRRVWKALNCYIIRLPYTAMLGIATIMKKGDTEATRRQEQEKRKKTQRKHQNAHERTSRETPW